MCFATVLLAAGATTAQASHDGRTLARPRFAPAWARHARRSPAAEFERGLFAGCALGERIGCHDGVAGRPRCLEDAGESLPRDRGSTAHLEGFRKGYHQGHGEGRQVRNRQRCH